jgi:hypothetical protein
MGYCTANKSVKALVIKADFLKTKKEKNRATRNKVVSGG